MTASWKKSYNPKPFLDSIEKCKCVDESGKVEYQGFDILTVPASINSMVQLDSRISEYEKYVMVREGIFECGRKGKINKDNLVKIIRKYEREHLKAPNKKFILMTTFSIDRFVKINKCSIDGNVLTFTSSYPKKFYQNTKDVYSYHFTSSFTGKPPRDYITIRSSVSAKSTHDAFEKGLFSLNLMRGIWNLFFNRSTPISFRSHRTPINRITLGPIHTLHHPNGKLASEEWMYEPDYRTPLKAYRPMNVGELEKMLQFGKDMRRRLKQSSYEGDIKAAIVEYCQALDSYNWGTSFVELWSLLEHLTNTKNHSYDTTIKRAKFLCKDPDAAHQSLNYLREFRNSLVHVSKCGHGLDIFIFELKYYVERLLGFHLFNNYKFKSIGEACQFLDLPFKDEDLKNKLDLVLKAQKFRRNMLR